MKRTNWLQKVFSSPTSPSKKTKYFLSKEREWLLSTEENKPQFIPEETWEESEKFLKNEDFVVEWLGLPTQAFQSYKLVSGLESQEFSLLKIRLLYKENKNYIYHILHEAQQKGIIDDMVIKIFNDQLQVMNTITLREAKIQTIDVMRKLNKKKSKSLHAKVLFVHKKRIIT